MVFAFTKNFEIFVFPYATVLQPNTQTNTYMIMYKITHTHTHLHGFVAVGEVVDDGERLLEA